jgi:hypothetical protein
MNCTHSRDYLFKLLNNCTANSKVCHFFVFMENGGQMQLAVTYRAAERGGRGGGNWVLGAPRIFLLGRKGQDICFFWAKYPNLVWKIGGGGRLLFRKKFCQTRFHIWWFVRLKDDFETICSSRRLVRLLMWKRLIVFTDGQVVEQIQTTCSSKILYDTFSHLMICPTKRRFWDDLFV